MRPKSKSSPPPPPQFLQRAHYIHCIGNNNKIKFRPQTKMLVWSPGYVEELIGEGAYSEEMEGGLYNPSNLCKFYLIHAEHSKDMLHQFDCLRDHIITMFLHLSAPSSKNTHSLSLREYTTSSIHIHANYLIECTTGKLALANSQGEFTHKSWEH